MREIGEAIQAYILAGCSVAMGVVICAVIVRMVAGAAISFRRVPCAAAISLMALWCTYIGGTKPEQVMIRFDEGLYNDGTEVSTNNPYMITFRWKYDAWIPPVTTVTVSANPMASSANRAAKLRERIATNDVQLAAIPVESITTDADAARRYAALTTEGNRLRRMLERELARQTNTVSVVITPEQKGN